jgi:hypothetical protein
MWEWCEEIQMHQFATRIQAALYQTRENSAPFFADKK